MGGRKVPPHSKYKREGGGGAVRGPVIGPTLGTLSFHLVTLSMSRLRRASYPSFSLPLCSCTLSSDHCRILSRPFSYLTYVHLCIPAADFVPAADGLGFRVSSTAPS